MTAQALDTVLGRWDALGVTLRHGDNFNQGVAHGYET